MSLKQRIFYLDELRMIAILAVILCHVDSFYPYVTTSLKVAIPYFLTELGRIGVPLFLMISGALLIGEDYDLGFFLKKRFSRILVPFIFWVIVISAYQFYVLKTNPVGVLDWALGKGVTWYVYELIGAYFMIPIINSFIKEYGDKAVKYFLILWAVTLLIQTFNYNPIDHFKLDYFAGFIGTMVFGHYLYTKKFNLSDGAMILIGILLFIVFYAINCANTFYTTSSFSYHSVVPVLQAAGVFLTFRYLSEYKNNNPGSFIGKVRTKIEDGVIGKIVLSISTCSYAMYFTHTIVYMTLRKYLEVSSLKLLPVLFIVTVVLSWAIAYASSKIPYISKVCGVK